MIHRVTACSTRSETGVCRFEEQTSKGFMWRDIGLGDWDECLDLNLRSSWLCAREAHPLLSAAAAAAS